MSCIRLLEMFHIRPETATAWDDNVIINLNLHHPRRWHEILKNLTCTLENVYDLGTCCEWLRPETEIFENYHTAKTLKANALLL